MDHSIGLKRLRCVGITTLAVASGVHGLKGDELYELVPFQVTALPSANIEPSTSFASLVSHLRYAPEIDLQTRGFPEGQSDVTVRGSTFEQTGFSIGGIAVYDPQTGHYSAEIPFDPTMLSAPRLLLGSENALKGFNSNVATIAYDWAQITDRGQITLGAGSDDLNYQSLYQGVTLGSGWAADLSLGRSEGDGTIENGDFEMARFAGRLQYYTEDGLRVDLFAGYEDKFYGWPNLYIGNAYNNDYPETDDYQNLITGFSIRQDYGNESYLKVGGLYRELIDDYEYDRTRMPNNDYEHRTKAFSLGIEGRHYFQPKFSLDYSIKGLRDELVRSTSLKYGDASTGNDFTERDYLKLGVAPRLEWTASDGSSWTFLAGVTVDASDQDKGSVNPLVRLEREMTAEDGLFRLFVDYSETSQVAGYTALRSPTGGLFGGNPNLSREVTRTGEIGFDWEEGPWLMTASVFYRKDDELTDWVYSFSSPSSRSASPVDLETLGGQFQIGYTADAVAIRLGYTGLEKDSDYGTASVDASYYALNYARHLVDLSATWTVVQGVELALDLEYRDQFENALRTNGDHGFLVSASAWWSPEMIEGLTLGLLVDNLTDEDFQEFPGTPAPGRRYSVRLTYRW